MEFSVRMLVAKMAFDMQQFAEHASHHQSRLPRRFASALVEEPDGHRTLVVKGAPATIKGTMTLAPNNAGSMRVMPSRVSATARGCSKISFCM